MSRACGSGIRFFGQPLGPGRAWLTPKGWLLGRQRSLVRKNAWGVQVQEFGSVVDRGGLSPEPFENLSLGIFPIKLNSIGKMNF